MKIDQESKEMLDVFDATNGVPIELPSEFIEKLINSHVR